MFRFGLLVGLLASVASYGQMKEELPTFTRLDTQGQSVSILQVFPDGINAVIDQHYKGSKEYEVLFLGIKFNVDKKGKVVNTVTSTNTPDFLTSFLKKNLEKTSGEWKPRRINGTAVDSDPIIITYYLSIEPANGGNEDERELADLLLKSMGDLPALVFADDSESAGYESMKMHGTFYKPILIRSKVFQEGHQK